MSYQYTTNWFESVAKTNWDQLVPQIKPSKILEVGSFEGASTVYCITENNWTDALNVVCVDTWEGGIEHKNRGIDTNAVEQRFDQNIETAIRQSGNNAKVRKMKGRSDRKLAELIADGHAGTFDLVYVDGSHQAPDVLLDALLGFKLCKVGGFIFFDDYLWSEHLETGIDPIRSPKIAIDNFTNTFCRHIKIVSAPLYQLYVQKTSDTE
jgi:predicted O-methyltransferase YrrM